MHHSIRYEEKIDKKEELEFSAFHWHLWVAESQAKGTLQVYLVILLAAFPRDSPENGTAHA